jgi:hypothetical protein
MKRVLAALALMGAMAGPARGASELLPDYSDLWWNAAESGWGAHITLQSDVVFLVLYVFDEQGRPRFFVASDMRVDPSLVPSVFRGTLYRSRGSPFAAAYDPSRFAINPVGTATLSFDSPGTGTLSYSVDGTTVTKSITRQAYRPVNLAGDYFGGTFVAAANCTGGTGFPKLSYAGTVHVEQAGDAVTIDTFFDANFAQGGHCRYAGKVVQLGSIAAITQGTYSCTFEVGPEPLAGTFEISPIEVNDSGISGIYRGVEGSPNCRHNGSIGGIRRGDSSP